MGVFAAMTSDVSVLNIIVNSRSLAEDLAELLPFTRKRFTPEKIDAVCGEDETLSEVDDQREGTLIGRDVELIRRACELLALGTGMVGDVQFAQPALEVLAAIKFRLPTGGDLLACAGNMELPIHAAILAARSIVLRTKVFTGEARKHGLISIALRPPAAMDLPRLQFDGCHPLTVLLLLQWMYMDDVAAIWDRRIAFAAADSLKMAKIVHSDIKSQLLEVSRLLGLKPLAKALEGLLKIEVRASLVDDIAGLYRDTLQELAYPPLGRPDVVIELADRSIPCHSVILRVRSGFFAAFFDDEAWTRNRKAGEGLIRINLRHLEWDVVEYIFRYMYCAEDKDMFHQIGS